MGMHKCDTEDPGGRAPDECLDRSRRERRRRAQVRHGATLAPDPAVRVSTVHAQTAAPVHK